MAKCYGKECLRACFKTFLTKKLFVKEKMLYICIVITNTSVDNINLKIFLS